MSKQDTKDLLEFLKAFPPESQDIALGLRDFVWDLYPDCNELIYDNYNFLAVGWAPTDKMGDIFCSIAVGMRGVMFGFMWGVKLDDPKGLLNGDGKQFRSLRVPDIAKFPKGDVKKLLEQAYELSLERLKGRMQTRSGSTIVKSISAKQRRPGTRTDSPKLRRERYPMPGDVLDALEKTKLFDAYEARPPYQRNDYIGWITRAKQAATRETRLAQMLDELKRGDVYMKMAYGAGKSKS